jgi:GntR family transcriptional regulator/MocR family aminotransferase
MRTPFLALALDATRREPLQQQLTAGLKRLMHGKLVRAGQALPSSRELAADLRISRNTVTRVYDRLVGEGYLEARPRSGLYVTASLLANPGPNRPAPKARANGEQVRLDAPLPFRPCQPDARLFPLALWNRMRSRALRRHGARLLEYQSTHPLGLPALRQSLASYLRESRGVRCDWRNVAITSGSQHALYLLAELLLTPRHSVMLEDPGYLGARQVFERVGARVLPLRVDAQGLVPPLRQVGRGAMIYTTPSRQFPTGACMPVARRLALVELAKRWGVWILEDDYDSEFRYSRPPFPSLQGLDHADRVIYVGTMSKVLCPSLRIGYVVLPGELVEPFARLRSVTDDHGPLIDQGTLAAFVDAGAFYTHLRRCRREYGERLATFLAAAEHAALPLRFPHADGGMNVAGFAEGSLDDDAMSRALLAEGLEVPSLSSYSLRPRVRGLVFGFTAFDHARIRSGVERVARVMQARGGRDPARGSKRV